MKKNIMYFAAMMCCMFMFSACGGDDEPKVETRATAVYNFTVSPDLLKAANVFITYKGDNGRNIKEAVTATAWTKTVTTTSFPAQFGIKYEFSTKNDSELTQDSYDLNSGAAISVAMTNGASFNYNTTILSANGTAKNRIASTLDDVSGKSYGYKVTKEGHASPANDLRYD